MLTSGQLPPLEPLYTPSPKSRLRADYQAQGRYSDPGNWAHHFPGLKSEGRPGEEHGLSTAASLCFFELAWAQPSSHISPLRYQCNAETCKSVGLVFGRLPCLYLGCATILFYLKCS